MDHCNIIILGSGLHWPKEPNTIRVDILEGENVDFVFDLEKKHWPQPPFNHDRYIHANASHVVEHLEDIPAFFDNVWNILVPGGTVLIKTPDAISGPLLAFSDPTHEHYLTKWSFINYVTPQGRTKFGYTKHEWVILDLEVNDGEVVCLLGKVPDNSPTIENLQSKLKNG